MSHPRKDSVAASFSSGQKILFVSAPGRIGLLSEGEKKTAMKFKDGHAALTWCEKNQACLFYMPAEETKN